MALNKFGVNLIFACVVVALGVTVVIAISVGSRRLAIRPAATQETVGTQLPENHPSVEIANRLMSLEQLAAKDPQNADYRTQIANLYYDMGQYDKAADFYQQSLNIRPQDPRVQTDLATSFYYLGESDKALATLDKVLKYDPNFSQALLNKGVILVSGKNDAKGAIKVWEDLLRSDPNFPQKAELKQRIDQLKASIK
jgi:tetratricopeptide (TPR) repeat protein